MGPSGTANAASNYVTLGVGDEIFAVDVAIVREILAYRTVAHLPNAPPFPVGVIDVRGCTVPVTISAPRNLSPVGLSGSQNDIHQYFIPSPAN